MSRRRRPQPRTGHCPRCYSAFVRRSRRRGVVERLATALYVYPFRCQLCGHRFRAFRPGVRYVPLDRREYERLPARLPATFRWGAIEGEGVVGELSIDGCSLETGADLAPGEQIELQIRVPGERTPLAVSLAVVRGLRPWGFGLEFALVPEPDRTRLRDLVRHWLREQGR